MAVERTDNQGHTEDFEAHVRDYSAFTKLFTYGAIAALLTGLFVMLIL